MITKKVNKSSQLIFISPNYLKLSDSKPMIKKSLHLASPKGSSKPTIRTVYKPLTTSKKSKDPSKHYHEEQYISTGGNRLGVSSVLTNSKIKGGNNTTSKRSKSKLTVGEHLSTDLWRSSVYESLSRKDGVSGGTGGETYRRPQSIDMKCKGEKQKRDEEKSREREKVYEREKQKQKGNRGSMGVKQKGRREVSHDQKYQIILNQTHSMLKKYTNVILQLKDEVKDLHEENLLLRKKLNII